MKMMGFGSCYGNGQTADIPTKVLSGLQKSTLKQWTVEIGHLRLKENLSILDFSTGSLTDTIISVTDEDFYQHCA